MRISALFWTLYSMSASRPNSKRLCEASLVTWSAPCPLLASSLHNPPVQALVFRGVGPQAPSWVRHARSCSFAVLALCEILNIGIIVLIAYRTVCKRCGRDFPKLTTVLTVYISFPTVRNKTEKFPLGKTPKTSVIFMLEENLLNIG